MFTNLKRQEILQKYKNKEERLFISNILDKAFKFEKNDKIEHTNFLNINELEMAKNILNEVDANYFVYKICEDSSKSVIFFLPDYVQNFEKKFISDYIFVIKIIPKENSFLKHKDYMGAIYSLGIQNNMIGDIFLCDSGVYVSFMKAVEGYILNNLFKVKNQEVSIQNIDIASEELKNIHINYIDKILIVPSLRIDAIISTLYNIGRATSKQKIVSGDLYINDKNIIVPDTKLKMNDIVSIKKCGKFKFAEVLSETKSGNYRISLKLYN